MPSWLTWWNVFYGFSGLVILWRIVWVVESIEKLQAQVKALEDGQRARDEIIQKWRMDDPWDLILLRHRDRLDTMEAALAKLKNELGRSE